MPLKGDACMSFMVHTVCLVQFHQYTFENQVSLSASHQQGGECFAYPPVHVCWKYESTHSRVYFEQMQAPMLSPDSLQV